MTSQKVDDLVERQVDQAAQHPLHAGLVEAQRVVVVGAALQRLVVDDREQREADIRKHEEVRTAPADAERRRPVLQVVEVDDQPEHEHRAEDRPERRRDRGGPGQELLALDGHEPAPVTRISATRDQSATGRWQSAMSRPPIASSHAPGCHPKTSSTLAIESAAKKFCRQAAGRK